MRDSGGADVVVAANAMLVGVGGVFAATASVVVTVAAAVAATALAVAVVLADRG
nr:hypothetical protein Ade03nite_88440 [Actinoplanes derwentensis]